MRLEHIRTVLDGPLDPHLSTTCRTAAVLVIIYGNVPHIVMTQKSRHMRIHAGEISFPGGKPEASDKDLCETALRETHEEIGLAVSHSDVIGQLDPVLTRNSKFLILPFVTVLQDIPPLVPNNEVERIMHIPLESFLKTLKPDLLHGNDMFALQYQNKSVWGASARILKHLGDLLTS